MPNFDGGHYFLTVLAPLKNDTIVDDEGRHRSRPDMLRDILGCLPTAQQCESGPDMQADEGESVILDASRSHDPDDGIDSYQWSQISGTPVTLFDANTAKATFTAPDIKSPGETLKFQLKT